MHKNKLLCLIAVLLCVSTMLSGCKSADKPSSSYNSNAKISSVSSETLAQNDNYELSWSDSGKCVILKELSTGKIWSGIPYEYLLEGGMSASLNSTLNIKIMNNTNRETTLIRGYLGAIQNGKVSAEKIKNGIKVTYYFDEYKISVPISYILTDDYLSVSLDAKEITEGTDYYLMAVSVAPFLCSASNTSSDDYIFVPSGSGALMYAEENAEGSRQYSGEVFGTDASRPVPIVLTDEEPVRLPVFGIKSGSNAIVGILDNGASSVLIEAEAGNTKTHYSNVYPIFYVRGYDVFEEAHSDLTLASELHSKDIFSVRYYTLSGEKADYNGMAQCYKHYLTETKALKKSELQQSPYSITVLGAVKTTASILGIPYQKLNAMTTFKQSSDILNELLELSNEKPAVLLKGFGEGGIGLDDKLAGGYSFPSVLGSNKERNAFEKLCADNEISLFTDFDLIHFNKSANGFSKVSDAAKTAVLMVAEGHLIKDPLRQYDLASEYRFLKRSLISDAVDKLIMFSEKQDISGISVYSLGDISYSDYTEQKYYAKGDTDADVKKHLEKLLKSERNIASGSNSCAAAVADTVFGVPISHGDYDAFDERIPFYQMVFGGFKPIYTSGSNLCDNFDKQLALAASSGTGFDFTVIAKYDVSFMENNLTELYAALFVDNKELIEKLLKTDYPKLINSVSGASIVSYEMISSAVARTIYDNGVTVYTNLTDTSADSPVGILDAYQFSVN